MDINSLLSPQDSPVPARETPPPARSPAMRSPSRSKRAPSRMVPSRTPSGLSQQITSSPQHHFHHDAPPPPVAHAAQALYHAHPHPHPHHTPTPTPAPPPAIASPGVASYMNGRGVHSADTPPPIGSPRDARLTPHRQPSTPGMDALADLASMQHVQQSVRQHTTVPRPSISLANIPRTISGGSEVTMADPSPRPPRLFQSQHLDVASIDMLDQLEKALIENPFDYYSHVSFISILHQGLQNVLYPADGTLGDGYSYELLTTLRDAFQAMDKQYNLGERLWEYRIHDEKALARNVEERMGVLELCSTATAQEPYSVKLWVMHGDYIHHLINCTWDPNPVDRWSDDDKTMGKELFKADLLMETWHNGAEYVKYNISQSNLVWDRYLELQLEDLERHYSPDTVRRVSTIFTDRLAQPHSTWDNTLSMFSSFNSRFNQSNYEEIMERTVQQNSHIKKTYTLREEFEFNLLKAIQAGDQDAEYYAMTRYLKWEKKTIGISSFPLVNGLYERATVRFPVDSALWEDHAEFLIWQNNRSVSLLDVLERATRHCPWSGSLWSHRLLTLEAEQHGHADIEAVKHSATRTGMLEHTDLEELMKVQIAWCGYLRRKAFDINATEDDVDIAEIGIRSALELAFETGTKKYGKGWVGDPQYRLERIHIKFLTQRCYMQEARQIFDSLVKTQEDSYEFWYRYYIWEMVVWSNHLTRDSTNVGKRLEPPSGATAALERALKRLHTLDQPELLVEMYVNHCEQHESVLKARSALIEKRRAQLIISVRREREAVARAQQMETDEGSSKRKREDGIDGEDVVAKKAKASSSEEAAAIAPSIEALRPASEAPSVEAALKRDRENTSVIVRKLPKDTTQTRLRQFFTDAGTVRNLALKLEGETMMATVEFELPDEAEYALTKEAKGFEGHDITITRGQSTTLYVTNYPAHADEAYIRDLFSPHGQILDMRFPSLQYDAHRRFCYIQFSNPNEAIAATMLDGSDVEGLKLIAKISDPKSKKKREGATEEGREVYVKHLTWDLKRADVKEAFAKFGRIENINLPTNAAGKFKGNNKGFCFIIYDTKEHAEAAVAAMHETELAGFKLHVEIAKTKDQQKPKIKSEITNNTQTPEAETSPAESQPADDTKIPPNERSIAILDLPDTVNDARVRALVEPFHYKKITLMPQHAGAIIEFTDATTPGKAGLALDGHEIAPGRKIRIGTVAELKKTKAEYKPSNNFIQPARVNRPVPRGGAFGGRGRGKPGLGHRPTAPNPTVDGSEKKEVKSNQAFRAMLLGKNGGDAEMKDAEDAKDT